MHEQVEPIHFKCVTKRVVCLLAELKRFIVMDVAVHSYRQKRNGLYDSNIPEKSSVQSRLLKERVQLVLERG